MAINNSEAIISIRSKSLNSMGIEVVLLILPAISVFKSGEILHLGWKKEEK
jgi:hypothetical protein